MDVRPLIQGHTVAFFGLTQSKTDWRRRAYRDWTHTKKHDKSENDFRVFLLRLGSGPWSSTWTPRCSAGRCSRAGPPAA